MQPRDCACAHDPSLVDVTLPMHIADEATVSERASARQNSIGLGRSNFGENECPGPSDGGVS